MGFSLNAFLSSIFGNKATRDIKEIRSDDVVSYVSVDVNAYRRSTRAVRKTLSIPEWLAIEAEKRNLSLSKVLQEGLKSQLGL